METAHYADIIFFAIIALVILLKLFNSLGRKDSRGDANVTFNKTMQSQKKACNNVTCLPKVAPKVKPEAVKAAIIEEPEPIIADAIIAKNLDEIKTIDKTFRVNTFLKGAKIAFEMVLKAFSEGDHNTLRQLLSKDVYKDFVGELNRLANAKKREDTTLVSILSSTISDALLQRNKARITVEFVSEQIQVTKDESGKIVNGDPSVINKVKDLWTFERDVHSLNPNWSIVTT